jgi:hypothetical protein
MRFTMRIELLFSTKEVVYEALNVYKMADEPKMMENHTFEKEEEKFSFAHIHAKVARRETCIAPC